MNLKNKSFPDILYINIVVKKRKNGKEAQAVKTGQVTASAEKRSTPREDRGKI